MGDKIRYYDQDSGQWIVAGASNAANIELTNPGFVNEAGESISVNNGFTKLDNRITKLEHNLAWIYLNGAKGGGGGGGTGGDGEGYTLTIQEGDIVYTTSSNVTLNILIKSGGLKKSFTVTVKDLSSGKIIGTYKRYSMAVTSIDITGLSGTTNLEVSAYDVENVYAEPAYITVVAGAISLTLDNTPSKTIYIGGINEVLAIFTVTNNIQQSTSSFKLTCNDIVVAQEDNITETSRTLRYDLRDILFNSEHFSPKAGQKFTFVATASTELNGAPLEATPITFSVTTADSNNLVIITEGISEYIPGEEGTWEDLTSFSQGSQLLFTYYLSYAPTKYSTFNMDYTIFKVNSDGEEQIDSGTIKNIAKSESKVFSYSTVSLDESLEGEYLKIVLYGYSTSNPSDTSAQYTKEVTCRISEAVSVDLYARNYNNNLLLYMSRVTGFPNTPTGTWKYPIKTSGEFKYTGAFRNSFPDGINLTLHKVNGNTTGFIVNSDGVNNIPAIMLSGGSYGILDAGHVLFPQLSIENTAFASCFDISCTFKATSSADESETVLSLGTYENDELKTGYEITLTQAKVKIGSASAIVVTLPQDKLVTVDLNVQKTEIVVDPSTSSTKTAYYFIIYLNGIMSACKRVYEEDIDWFFGQDIYLGCRNDNGNLSKFSTVSFYDFKIYTATQSEVTLIQNYISATEQAQLKNGSIDQTLDAELREKNLFDSAGNCLIWDYTNEAYYDGEQLYRTLYGSISNGTPYPLVLIKETSSNNTLFERYSSAIWGDAANKDEIINTTFPCSITYTTKNGECTVSTPSGVDANKGTRIGLQGTSSLSYNSKNYEIYMGDMDEAGTPLLFNPTDDWLPENEFTLKADVVDSGHVNNVVIGQIINGKATNSAGVAITPFTNTPPMELENSIWETEEKALQIKSKMKHTSEGFPVLLFIQFAPKANGDPGDFRFCGIYNFNLGRYAYYNLGLKLLLDYTKEVQDGPSLISSYKENSNYWNNSTLNGVHSMEVNQNDSSHGAFEQDDMKIIQYMLDSVYSSRDTSTSYNKVQQLYTQLANMCLVDTPKYTMNDSNTDYKEIPGESYKANQLNEYYNFSAFENKMNWNNACAYFVIGIVFGLVDSMCKNLTLRNWGTDEWWTAFYDMDTAFKLNNTAQEVVEYWAHLHRWYNYLSPDGITTYGIIKNYEDTESIKQYYASWWNRIWEVLENLASKDAGAVADKVSIESIYQNLRANLFPDPKKFIEDYYKSYINQCGGILYNFDYKIKYISISKKWNDATQSYVDDTSTDQTRFLYGTRADAVADWFQQRVYFLDCIYGVSDKLLESPANNAWSNNKVKSSTSDSKLGITLAGDSKVLFKYSYETSGAFWVDESPYEAIVPTPKGETVANMYANRYITKFDNFKGYTWTSLPTIDFPLLEELDLSGLSNMDSGSFFTNGVYDAVNNIGLKNIKKLNLSRVSLIGNQASSYTLDVSSCSKLQELDISYSTITNVKLSSSASLKKYNLAGTNITKLELSDQAFLEEINIQDCNKLVTINISNCSSLRTLQIPNSVQSVTITNCPELETLVLTYTSVNNSISNLSSIVIDECPGLKTFNISGQNNPNLQIQLIGGYNIESLDLSNTKSQNIVFSDRWTTLKTLNIANTKIKSFNYNGTQEEYLDLSMFPNLQYVYAYSNNELSEIKCRNDQQNPIKLSDSVFKECTSLKRVYGNLQITGSEVFRGCSSLIINTPDTYSSFGYNDFIEGDDVTNVGIGDEVSTVKYMFENCSSLSYDDFKYIMYKLNSNINSLEGLFNGCSNISGDIWRTIFKPCPNITSIKNAFSGTGLSGALQSRQSSYSSSDDSTWGIFDFTPKLTDAESAFQGTLIEWIDNNLFAPTPQGVVSPLVKINYMFSGCRALKSCEDTTAGIFEEGYLKSKTFFTNLKNLTDVYPRGVFSGCEHVKMQVETDSAGNTYIFHTTKSSTARMILTNEFLTGIKLVGTITPNVFGGISQTISDNGTTYYIPTFTSIQYPFIDSGGELYVNLNEMGNMFQGISSTLLQAVGIFSGVQCNESTDIIPDNIFRNCSALNSIQAMFQGMTSLTNNGEIYQFPPQGMFDDCTALSNTSSLFEGCYNLRMTLVGEGFKNCKLSNVSSMFSNSGVLGMIPYRLFFMSIDNGDGSKSIRQTITDISKVFDGCYYLGYDSSRKLNIGFQLDPEDETSVTRWSDHIIETEGNRVPFKLNTQNLTKSYNYDRNEDSESEDYNPGEQAFDVWYIDGYGWEDATSSEEGLEEAKARLNKYFEYDARQKEALKQLESNPIAEPGYQNYAFPTDYFRYCSPECTLENSLSGMFYKKNTLKYNDATGRYTVEATNDIDGIVGRIPCKVFEALKNTTSMSGVFSNTRFCSFVNINVSTVERGLAYPFDLFKYNTKLTSLTSMFAGTIVEVGVDINSNLFETNSGLTDVSSMWQNCQFDNRKYGIDGAEATYPQIDFSNIFKDNTRIQNASGLFSVTNLQGEKQLGLRLIERTLLETCYNITNISNMFYYNTAMVGEVPTFKSATYQYLTTVSGYLTGVSKSNIANESELEAQLRPSTWDA